MCECRCSLHVCFSACTSEYRCRRLSLTPLAYLWQRDQGELLSEMIDAGLEAILIKVAGIGLDTKHLGKTLEQMQPTLLKLVRALTITKRAICRLGLRTNSTARIYAAKVESTRP